MSPRRLLDLVPLLALSVLAVGCGPSRPRPAHRLLIVGWDGATWRTLDPLLAQGRLPNLERLIARGVSARLESTVVPISSAAWVGAVTGRQPGETGVYGFFEPIEGTYDVRLISSLSNRATPLWRILARHGRRSVVFGVPVTWPPEPIPGVLVGCMLAPFDSTYAHPPELTAELRRRGFVPDLGIWRTEQMLTQEVIDRDNRIKREVLLELMRAEDWDLFFVVFKNLDVLSHYAYVRPDSAPIQDLCAELDRILGDLVAAAGEATDVIVLSDHGFNAYESSFFVHPWLIEQGLAVRRAKAEPGPIPGPLDARRAREHRRQMGELDLERTRAFAGLCEGNFGGVRLNLQGREPQGCVAPEQAEALLEEIEARLCGLRLPRPGGEAGGEPLVVRTWRGAALYPGPHSGLVPDLLFETSPSVAVSQNLSEQVLARWPVGAADHDRTGILAAAGPQIAGIGERLDASILDLAPTALALLDLSVYAEMDGRALVEILRRRKEVRVVADASEARPGEAAWKAARAAEVGGSAEVEERLRQLGYTK